MSELTQTGLSPAEIKKLTGMGVTSLRQIALMTPSMLGFGEAKAETIIRTARNLIANEAVARVELPKGKPEVRIVVQRIDQAVRTSIEGLLGANPKYCTITLQGSVLTITQRHGFAPQFKKVQESAKQWQAMLAAQARERNVREGLTLEKGDVQAFAKKHGLEGFASQVFQGIVGNTVMKNALSLALFSTYEEPVHTLVIGDPGSAKTLARDIIVGNFGNVTTVGANSTRSGLVCNLSTGEPGALASADQKVVLIDEFDKIGGPDLQACYELLSNGRCSIHSGRVHEDIVSRFILIGFANPSTATFSGNPVYDIGMESTLLSRFAFVVRTDPLSDSDKRKLFGEIFAGTMRLQNLPTEFDQWVKQARKHEPRIKVKRPAFEKFTAQIMRIVEEHASTPLRRDLRMGNHARRIAMSLARCEFTDVTDETLARAAKLIESYMRQWDE